MGDNFRGSLTAYSLRYVTTTSGGRLLVLFKTNLYGKLAIDIESRTTLIIFAQPLHREQLAQQAYAVSLAPELGIPP